MSLFQVKPPKPNRKKKWLIAFFIVFILATCSWFVASKYVQKYGYNGLSDFLSNYFSNSSKSSNAVFETLNIKIDNVDFKKLESLRQKHLDRGLIENDDESFVDANIFHKGIKYKAKVRLKGHMTDHLQEKKWSFRVKLKKGNALMGMKIFSLQHPGTRQYIYEWIYHQMMKSENIIALNYDFVKLKVNDEDWGVYALEENFEQELVKHNKRPKGPLIRFNPDLYWIYRMNEHEKINIDEPYSKFQSAFPEAYDQKNTFDDSTLLLRYQKAISIIEAVRRKKIPVHTAFDVDKLAMFHAIIDLVGGHHSLDWSDVKYFYNAETNLIEPVAYESFSLNNTTQLGAAFKFQANDTGLTNNWHEILFSDTIFFRKYISSLDKISKKDWLDKFFKSIKQELENKEAVLFQEFAYRKFDYSKYYSNQVNIRKILSVPKSIIPYFNSCSGQNISLKIGNADVYPYEILALKIDTNLLFPVNKSFIDAKRENSYVNYALVNFKNKSSLNINANLPMKVMYRLPGTKLIREMDVIPAKYTDENPIVNAQNLASTNFVNINGNRISFKSSKNIFTTSYFVPSNMQLTLNEGTEIDFCKNSSLFVHGKINCVGSTDNIIKFYSSDKSGLGIALINSSFKSVFDYCQFSNLGFANDLNFCLRAYNTSVDINNCTFSNISNNALHIANSSAVISNSFFGAINDNAIDGNYSNIKVQKCEFKNLKTALTLTNCKGLLSNCDFYKITECAVSAIEGTNMQVQHLNFNEVKIALMARDLTKLFCNNLNISNAQIGFKAYQKGKVYGPAEIAAKGVKTINVKVKFEAEKGSTITIIE